jgi:hypothetical protein
MFVVRANFATHIESIRERAIWTLGSRRAATCPVNTLRALARLKKFFCAKLGACSGVAQSKA